MINLGIPFFKHIASIFVKCYYEFFFFLPWNMEVIAHGNIFMRRYQTVQYRAEAFWRASLQGKALLNAPRLIFVIQTTNTLTDYRICLLLKVPRTHIFTDPQVPGMDSCISKTSAWPPTREERHRG